MPESQSAAAAPSRGPSAARPFLVLALRVLAVAIATYGQLQVVVGGSLTTPIRCYAAGIVLWLIAAPPGSRAGAPLMPRISWRRAGARSLLVRAMFAVLAAALTLWSVSRLRLEQYDSNAGVAAWAAGMIALVCALRDPRRKPGAGRPCIPLGELAVFAGILAVAVFFRFHRLGDWLGGVHGDEGEAALDSLRFLRGGHFAPFGTGWFGQGNLYYLGVALGMKLAGTGLEGIRFFSAVFGVLLLVPTYLLAREWFGARVALVASAFLAISGVAVNFSRLEFSNVTTPLSLAAGFLFFFLGLRRGRISDFVLAGFAHAAGLYFYQGARLTPILGAGFLVYLMTLPPLLAVLRRRSALPLGTRVRRQAIRVRRLLAPSAAYLAALLAFGAPFIAYSVDNREQATSRVKEKLVFNNGERMASEHAATHDPLTIGLRVPRRTEALPFPVTLQPTRFSVAVARDGFWARVLWRQLVVTLSILTLRFDASSVYTFSMEPIAKPFEAVLIILSLAAALARVRDPRFGALSIWFWGTVVAGGVFTIDAPYMARLVGILPVLAILAALTIDGVAAALDAALARFPRIAFRRAGMALSCVVLLLLARRNFADYFDRYTRSSPLPFAPTVGQAWFVRETNARAARDGEPPPHYYNLSAHLLYWSHSVNKFLNPAAVGVDMVNPAETLPLGDGSETDAVFMVWDHNRQYLPMLQAFYPAGREERFLYGPPGRTGDYLFTSYRVSREALLARHTTFATYTPARGPALSRVETGFGGAEAPPRGLVYPVRVRYQGALLSPAFAHYRLEVEAPLGAALGVDGRAVFASGARSGELVLARGLHDVELSADLATEADRIRLRWGGVGFPLRPVSRSHVFRSGPRSFLGVVRALPAGGAAAVFFRSPLAERLPLLSVRVDAFLGFKDTGRVFGAKPAIAVWRGTLKPAPEGRTRLELHAGPIAALYLDGERILDIPEGGPRETTAARDVTLGPGPHELEVWYAWRSDVGTLELYATPQGGERRLLSAPDVETSAGAFLKGEIAEPLEVPQLADARRASSARVLSLSALAHAPRALAVAGNGELYVADTGGHRVLRLDANGKLLGSFGRAGRGLGEFQQLEDIAIDGEGRIVALDSALSRVQVFTKTGALIATYGKDAGLCSPAGLSAGLDGTIYVADTCSNRLLRIGAGGKLVTEMRPASPGSFEQPVDVAPGPGGILYVADLTPRIAAFDPSTSTLRRSWPVSVGRQEGASNVAVCGTRLFMSDPDSDLVHAIDVESGTVAAFRGDPTEPFATPLAVACDAAKRLYVIDRGGSRLQIFPDPIAERAE